jgi:uncharacterized membrane protein (DUF4010 family)
MSIITRHGTVVHLLETREAHLAVAIALGLLIGAERERRQEQRGSGTAGMRTFTLAALLGGILAYSGALALTVTGAAIIAALALTSYYVNRDEEDRGTTTELALVTTYFLGALSIDHPVLAPGLAVVVTWTLAFRGELHRFVLERINERELRDALLFLLIALVVLPLSPDRPFGPYGALNPQSLVRLVVVLLALSSAGYVAQRLLDPRLGLAVAGLASGFVSSSATIATMSLRAREHPEQWKAAAAGGLASSVATIIQYFIVVASIDSALVAAMAFSLSLAGLAAAGIAGAFALLSLKDARPVDKDDRPFHLWMAVAIAAVFAAVTIASSALQKSVGRAGIVLVSAAAGLVDAHSTAGSIASMHHARSIDDQMAKVALLVALSANTLTKTVVAWSGRNVRYGVTVTLGSLAVAGAAWLGLLLG